MTAEMIQTELRDHLVRRSAWGKGHKINVSYQLRFSSFVRYQLKLGPFAVICWNFVHLSVISEKAVTF